MRITKILLFSCFIMVACNQQNSKQEKIKDNPLINNSMKDSQKNIRDLYSLFFQDNDTLNIVSNFHTKEKISSISKQLKELKGEYFYCGKSALNKKIFLLLNNIDKNDFKKINEINTSHNIIIGKDTLYLSGLRNIECFKEKDSVLIKSAIYTFHQKKIKTNLLIIEDLVKIK